MEKYLVTGAAGFIGSQLLNRLKTRSAIARGIDNYNDHLYSPQLKSDRAHHFDIDVRNIDLRNERELEKVIVAYRPTTIIHLAAHAGVRDSFGKEKQYHSNNIDATQNLIDLCKKHIPNVRIIYASTSCVFAGSELPWTEGKETGKQLNPYGWTKWVNECQFQSSGLHNIGLRFFTVYGPWGRPDMALFDFTKKILAEEEITVYNYGNMKRDFTYVEDILDGIECVIDNDVEAGEIFNIGRGQPVQLMDFIEEIEKNTGKKAIKNLVPKHPADTLETWSNTSKLESLGYCPDTDISVGIKNFYEWYMEYHNGR
jgi:UDP-glucuronate 4-epimerase